ncbi:multiprotein bridging factor aMBF1 [Candidatus Methanocrinis natronophilus]|uniref:Multiprotein bridging factor aMBF1 n=1 Tax=Candidatus Methanocrinis natronophilus TaxID=3033396 RepID=A0ABT5X4U7_9EURY|nr:multiprotein bridging factor aMBF1 [Candidatus Methanocrinis natronophilus]MDF0589720.1 multiprotein bridging factor aMBF1 [Candidatus Methanocrinis natronophilus]
MQCEICGAEVSGSPKRVVIDGSELQVCNTCARFGEVLDKFSPVPRKVIPQERAFRAAPKPRPRRDEFREMPEIVPEYGRIVKEAREGMELTPEELGLKIKEKASLIRKIERHEIVPEDSVRIKLERELNVKLTDKLSDEDWKAGKGGRGVTLGDIAFIKKR